MSKLNIEELQILIYSLCTRKDYLTDFICRISDSELKLEKLNDIFLIEKTILKLQNQFNKLNGAL